MRTRPVLPAIVLVALILTLAAGSPPTSAQAKNGTALAGQVTADREGPMEGVLVSAKKAGATITTTVVSDREGRYRFPAAKLAPGKYALTVRAVGFELPPTTVEVTGQKPATAVLRLQKAGDVSTQLTNAEWMQSVPGTPQQKGLLFGCVTCHTLERVVKSSHDAAGFLQVVERMGKYVNQSTPLKPQLRLADRLMEERGEARQRTRQAQAEFLASVNAGPGGALKYDFQTFPRPRGRGTNVVITEYDLPRPTIQPHDVILDADGIAWFCNFGEQTIGRLDPRTGKVTEFPIPESKKGFPTGALSMRADREGNLWMGNMFQGAAVKFDRKTQKFRAYSLPAEYNRDMTQLNMTSPWNAHVDGKVWTNNNGFAAVHRLDLASGTFETWEPFKASAASGKAHNIYDVIADSRNNVYFTDFANEHVGRIDAKTGKLSLYTIPTPRSAPRRAQMDATDRLWFGEYRGNRIGMFDTKTEKFTEWEAPTPWSSPYDVTLDKNGEAWTGSMLTDRILRLNTKTGEWVEYLLPRQTNVRRVFVDNSTTPVTFWVGNNHGASVIKLEPLD